MQTDERIVDLEAKLLKVTNEKAELRRDYKAALLNRGIYRALAEEMQALITPFDALPAAEPRHYTSKDRVVDETLVIHLSDEHADEVVEPHKVGNLETFNFPIALCRAENYVDSIIDWTQHTLTNHRFKRAVILSNGDHTSGQIHNGEGRSYHGNMFKNALAIGQMQALMVRDLAPFFEKVDVVCLSGNHGRRTEKKNYDGARDNWDYMISEIASMHARDIKNVKFHIPDCWSLILDIEGYGFCVAHGDDIKSWNGIPYYGIERKTRRLVSLHNSIGKRVHYFVFGHFHAMTMAADLKGETIINGAFPATDPYSYESFSGYREPMQLIHGVHPKYGITWRFPVKIKDESREARGPRRYSILLADDAFEA